MSANEHHHLVEVDLDKARRTLLESHWVPAVLGPRGRYHIVDHHHLGLAKNPLARYLPCWSGVIPPAAVAKTR